MMIDGCVAQLLQPIVNDVTSANEPPVPWTAILTAAAAALGLGWTILAWIYGGSRLKVKLELGYTDGVHLLKSVPRDFADPMTIRQRVVEAIGRPAIDVVVLTVINRGRTAATVHDPSLLFQRGDVDEVAVSTALIRGRGVKKERVRLEPNDSCEFVMPLAPLVESAEAAFGLQKAKGAVYPLRARGQVTSGTGRVKRSALFRVELFKLTRADWPVLMPLRGQPLTAEEQLVLQFLAPGVKIRDQLLDASAVFANLRDGVPEADLYPGPGTSPGEMLRVMGMIGRARWVIDEEKAAKSSDPAI
ncbi:hypothetical protein [Microbacterium panaciterrae]|uniref:Uncharacterized protein n=1 Tax=Microbacterium panaciterrae TaxID=985759 RepID=A0ABP8PWF8_9MICO